MSLAIDQALIQAFIGGNFGLPIAHENLDYSPDGTAYTELLCAQNEIAPFSLGHTDETSGVFKVILRYPTKLGGVPAKSKADEILSVFKVGATFIYSGVSVIVMGQQRQAGVAESGWFKIVLTIRYRSFLLR